MTTTTPTPTTTGALDTPVAAPSRRSTRWWVPLAAAVFAVAGVAAAVVVSDGSDTTRPVDQRVERVADAPAAADVAPLSPISADAAERRAAATAMDRCSGTSADAAERCLTAGP